MRRKRINWVKKEVKTFEFDCDLTIRELARLTGYNFTYFSKIFNGRPIPEKTFHKIMQKIKGVVKIENYE